MAIHRPPKRSPFSMEPALPSARRQELLELAAAVLHDSASLGGQLPVATRRGLTGLLRNINSYYSNLIEGHNTHPREVERALRKAFEGEPAKRALQLESVAHVQTQELLEARLAEEPDLDIASPEFLSWMHREFYQRMPPEFRWLTAGSGERREVVPGALRTEDVSIGLHHAPRHEDVPALLRRFGEAYALPTFTPLQRIIAAGASHHRLAWIHPFLDGNGRVMRLFTHAWLIRCRISGHGIWMVSRGLARSRQAYREALCAADEPRRGDFAGRGALSDEGLAGFCVFFLKTALDQIGYMARLLRLEDLWTRIESYSRFRASSGELPDEAGHLLVQALVQGEVPRGDAPRILGLKERTARSVVAQLLAERLLESAGHRAPLRLGFPSTASAYYFPDLFPSPE